MPEDAGINPLSHISGPVKEKSLIITDNERTNGAGYSYSTYMAGMNFLLVQSISWKFLPSSRQAGRQASLEEGGREGGVEGYVCMYVCIYLSIYLSMVGRSVSLSALL